MRRKYDFDYPPLCRCSCFVFVLPLIFMALVPAEIADPSSVSNWSWVDALFMAMNTYSRIGRVTHGQKYFDKQFANFNASALGRSF